MKEEYLLCVGIRKGDEESLARIEEIIGSEPIMESDMIAVSASGGIPGEWLEISPFQKRISGELVQCYVFKAGEYAARKAVTGLEEFSKKVKSDIHKEKAIFGGAYRVTATDVPETFSIIVEKSKLFPKKEFPWVHKK